MMCRIRLSARDLRECWPETSKERPYYMTNPEWYIESKHGNDLLSEKAPEKARESFIEFWGTLDPEGKAKFYFLSNPEWYIVDEHARYRLTEKAPKKVRNSFIKFWGSDDPEKRSMFYFLSNPEWYTVNVAAAKSGKRAFKLTKKATVEAVWSYGHYYLSSVFNEKPYYKRNKRWYTKDKQGHYILTKEAPPEAQANYYEFFGNLGLFMNDEYPWHA